jgi:hypothetical protein
MIGMKRVDQYKANYRYGADLLNRIPVVQECDATDAHQRYAGWQHKNQKNLNQKTYNGYS